MNDNLQSVQEDRNKNIKFINNIDVFFINLKVGRTAKHTFYIWIKIHLTDYYLLSLQINVYYNVYIIQACQKILVNMCGKFSMVSIYWKFCRNVASEIDNENFNYVFHQIKIVIQTVDTIGLINLTYFINFIITHIILCMLVSKIKMKYFI